MMRPEAQARGRRLRSSRGRGLGLKAASYPEPEARGFNQNIIIEEDPLLTPLDSFCKVIKRCHHGRHHEFKTHDVTMMS